MLLENPWKYDFRDSKFQNIPTCLGLQELVPLVRTQSRLLFIISLPLKNFLTALQHTSHNYVLSNLLPVSNICGEVLISLFWALFELSELLEMGFKLPFNLMGRLTVVLFTGQSWHILKSWCKFGGQGPSCSKLG